MTTRLAKKSEPSRAAGTRDAISLLKADHRQVEDWFEEYEVARSSAKKQQLATRICAALKIHTMIEEEIFYPAFLAEVGDTRMHHEAIVEHDGAKKLINEIEASTSGDDYFDAKSSVLSDMIKHHVKEEEGPGGMFSEARKSDLDLRQLGQRLAARKEELQNEQPSLS